jgi:hypothetical protein
LDVAQVYLDWDRERRDRRRMFANFRAGDVLVLLRPSDLGAGMGLHNMRADLEAKGVTVEIAPAAPKPPAPKGRPPAWKPDAETDARFRALWADVAVDGGYLLDLACDDMGEDKTDKKARERVKQRLQRRYGSRSGR